MNINTSMNIYKKYMLINKNINIIMSMNVNINKVYK